MGEESEQFWRVCISDNGEVRYLIACRTATSSLATAVSPQNASAAEIVRYQKKISGPILDRIDMWVNVLNIDYDKLVK
jgi:predicted ATPase with chaperone activity